MEHACSSTIIISVNILFFGELKNKMLSFSVKPRVMLFYIMFYIKSGLSSV